jgi:hypothetical protein
MQLSGGGQYGAFGAGFLNGWTQTGTRPEFDIVTGVSTGALLATHAFLGTPADDAVLKEIFTTVGPEDIYTRRSILGLLFGGTSLYDTTPLQRLLDKYMTAEVLERVAEAHANHRRLYIGTTNLDYNQTWVWNMGKIAQQGTPEALKLYKQVLRASAAPPLAFPPEEIYGYLFADGGVRQNIVVIGLAGVEEPKPPQFGPGTIYVIQNGQGASEPRALKASAIGIAGPVLNTMLTTSMESLLMRSFFAAKHRGYHFRMVSLPDELDVGHNALAFDPQEMQDSFDAGLAMGQQPDPWTRVPPVIEDIPDWVLDIQL